MGANLVFLAEDASGVVDAAKTVLSGVTGTLSVANIAAVLAAGVGGGVALYLLWFGVRKLIKIISSAMNGKLKV